MFHKHNLDNMKNQKENITKNQNTKKNNIMIKDVMMMIITNIVTIQHIKKEAF